jgi:hypothetical protein
MHQATILTIARIASAQLSPQHVTSTHDSYVYCNLAYCDGTHLSGPALSSPALLSAGSELCPSCANHAYTKHLTFATPPWHTHAQ